MLSLLTTLLISSAVSVYNPRIPVIVDRDYNIVSEIVVTNDAAGEVTGEVEISLEGIPLKAVKNVSLMYTGTVSPLYRRSEAIIARTQFGHWGSGQRTWRDPRYATRLDSARPGKDGKAVLSFGRNLVKGENHFYVSLCVAGSKVGLADTFGCRVERVRLDGVQVNFEEQGPSDGRRYAVALRDHGDDGADSYRIPGLATAKNGDLIAVYDVRWDSSVDLQSDIDIAAQRSSDGGRTWSRMQIAMDMGEYGGLPQAQNGVGDPCVLVDERSGDIFIFALWGHGLKGHTTTSTVATGFDPIDVPQLVMVRSRDGGKSWSAPINITQQVKFPDCSSVFQGPGRGITMSDGTLVVPVQVWKSGSDASTAIIFSKDGGDSWEISSIAASNVCEDQVAEVSPGVLMLNMRNYNTSDRGRKVYVTEDLGRSWKVHPSNGLLPEPQCQASLLSCGGLLLFANPASTSSRVDFTVRASCDGGLTWPHSLLLDEGQGWGYSCMTMIDNATLGILYEGSGAQIVFQAVRLGDLVDKEMGQTESAPSED